MAINFPDSPSNGDVAHGFTYDSTKGVWNSAGVSDTAVTVYANLAAFPSSGNTVGDYAFATDTKALYIWDGAEWDRISTGNNETPIIITDPTDTSIAAASTDSSRTTFRVADPEGFPITYDIAYMRDSDKVLFKNDSANLPPPLAHPTQITTAADGTATYRFLTRQTESDGSGNSTKDTYKIRYIGSDGSKLATSTKNFVMQFTTPITFGLVNSGSAWAAAGANATVTTGNTDFTNMLSGATSGGIGQLNQTAGMALSSPLPLGKKYFEFRCQNLEPYMQMGLIAQTTINNAGATTNGENESVGFYENSNVIGNYHYSGDEFKGNNFGAAVYTIPGGSWGNGEIIMIAYDTDTRAVWFGNGGNWHGTYSPITGTASGTLEGGSTDQPRFYMGGASSGADGWNAYTMRADDLTYSPPAGYTSV